MLTQNDFIDWLFGLYSHYFKDLADRRKWYQTYKNAIDDKTGLKRVNYDKLKHQVEKSLKSMNVPPAPQVISEKALECLAVDKVKLGKSRYFKDLSDGAIVEFVECADFGTPSSKIENDKRFKEITPQLAPDQYCYIGTYEGKCALYIKSENQNGKNYIIR